MTTIPLRDYSNRGIKGKKRYHCPACGFKCRFDRLVGPYMPKHDNAAQQPCIGTGSVPVSWREKPKE